MTATTSLARGESWVPHTDPDGFMERFTEVLEKHYTGTLTDRERQDWRAVQLQHVLRKVTERSPFYRRHLDGIDVGAITPDTIDRLPFTTKDDLRREMFDVLSGSVADAVYYYETTGTTGPATPCPRDVKEIVASNAHVTESWAHIFDRHFGGQRPAVGLMGPTEVHSFGDSFGSYAQNVGACNAKIWPYSPVIGFKKALQLIRDLRLKVLVATPGVCLNLARAAKLNGMDIRRDLDVEVFFLTGEMCTPALSENIDAVWGVTSYNALYGSQEAFVLGVACPSRRMRLTEMNYIVEVLDPDTLAPLGDRGTGELCVTMLADGIKPLVRYRTGDLVRISDDQHRPGELPGPELEVIGRVLDRLVIGGRTVAAATVETAILEGVRDCYGYQVVIDADATGDVLTVRLELENRDASHVDNQTAAICDQVEAALGVRCQVEIVDELDAVVSTGAFVSWKAARILDLRRAPSHEDAVAALLAGGRGIET